MNKIFKRKKNCPLFIPTTTYVAESNHLPSPGLLQHLLFQPPNHTHPTPLRPYSTNTQNILSKTWIWSHHIPPPKTLSALGTEFQFLNILSEAFINGSGNHPASNAVSSVPVSSCCDSTLQSYWPLKPQNSSTNTPPTKQCAAVSFHPFNSKQTQETNCTFHGKIQWILHNWPVTAYGKRQKSQTHRSDSPFKSYLSTDQGSANHSPQAESGQVPIFENSFIRKHTHAYSLQTIDGRFHTIIEDLSNCDKDCKYLLKPKISSIWPTLENSANPDLDNKDNKNRINVLSGIQREKTI